MNKPYLMRPAQAAGRRHLKNVRCLVFVGILLGGSSFCFAAEHALLAKTAGILRGITNIQYRASTFVSYGPAYIEKVPELANDGPNIEYRLAFQADRGRERWDVERFVGVAERQRDWGFSRSRIGTENQSINQADRILRIWNAPNFPDASAIGKECVLIQFPFLSRTMNWAMKLPPALEDLAAPELWKRLLPVAQPKIPPADGCTVFEWKEKTGAIRAHFDPRWPGAPVRIEATNAKSEIVARLTSLESMDVDCGGDRPLRLAKRALFEDLSPDGRRFLVITNVIHQLRINAPLDESRFFIDPGSARTIQDLDEKIILRVPQ